MSQPNRNHLRKYFNKVVANKGEQLDYKNDDVENLTAVALSNLKKKSGFLVVLKLSPVIKI